MKRREFIGFAGVAVASWPLVVWAEQAAKIPRIGAGWLVVSKAWNKAGKLVNFCLKA
jgi:hypothetical protein